MIPANSSPQHNLNGFRSSDGVLYVFESFGERQRRNVERANCQRLHESRVHGGPKRRSYGQAGSLCRRHYRLIAPAMAFEPHKIRAGRGVDDGHFGLLRRPSL